MASEAAIFEIQIRAEQAKRQLEELRGGVTTLGGGVDKLALSFSGFDKNVLAVADHVGQLREKQMALASALAAAGQATERDAVLMGALRKELEATTNALNAMGASQAKVTQTSVQHFPVHARLTDEVVRQKRGFFDLTDAGKRLQQQIGPQAAAISSIANALGDSNSATGRAVQMAGQLAAAWAAGGPLGVAVVGLSAGVIALTKHWDDLIRKQDEALTKQFAAANKVIDERKSVEARLAALQQELGGPETAAQARARVQREIDDAVRRRDEAREKRDRAGWANLNKTIALLEKVRDLEFVRAGIAEGKANKETKTTKTDTDVFDPNDPKQFRGLIDAIEGMDPNADRRRATAQLMKLDQDTRRKHFEERFKIAQRAVKMELSEEERLFERKKEMRAAERAALAAHEAYIASIASQSLGIVVGAAQQAIDGIITGQEHAIERFAAAVFRQAGTAVIGEGIKTAAAGIGQLAATGGIAGGPALATGAGLIGAGLALGGVGTGIEHTLIGGGTLFQKPPELDRGANSNRPVLGGGGGGGGGGPITFVNNYGVYGPSPEDNAREQQRMARTARRRGIV